SVARCDPGPLTVATPEPAIGIGCSVAIWIARLPVKGNSAALDVTAHSAVAPRTKRERTTARMGVPPRSRSQQDSFPAGRTRGKGAEVGEGKSLPRSGRGVLRRSAAPGLRALTLRTNWITWRAGADRSRDRLVTMPQDRRSPDGRSSRTGCSRHFTRA